MQDPLPQKVLHSLWLQTTMSWLHESHVLLSNAEQSMPAFALKLEDVHLQEYKIELQEVRRAEEFHHIHGCGQSLQPDLLRGEHHGAKRAYEYAILLRLF